jgi:hypothetical protein
VLEEGVMLGENVSMIVLSNFIVHCTATADLPCLLSLACGPRMPCSATTVT